MAITLSAVMGGMNVYGLEVPSIYFWGVLGSAVVELSAIVRETAANGGTCPGLYKRPFYISVRAALAFAAGFVPLMLEAHTVMNAFLLGASAPLFFDNAQRGISNGSNQT